MIMIRNQKLFMRNQKGRYRSKRLDHKGTTQQCSVLEVRWLEWYSWMPACEVSWPAHVLCRLTYPKMNLCSFFVSARFSATIAWECVDCWNTQNILHDSWLLLFCGDNCRGYPSQFDGSNSEWWYLGIANCQHHPHLVCVLCLLQRQRQHFLYKRNPKKHVLWMRHHHHVTHFAFLLAPFPLSFSTSHHSFLSSFSHFPSFPFFPIFFCSHVSFLVPFFSFSVLFFLFPEASTVPGRLRSLGSGVARHGFTWWATTWEVVRVERGVDTWQLRGRVITWWS